MIMLLLKASDGEDISYVLQMLLSPASNYDVI